jgi:hypothetical protein
MISLAKDILIVQQLLLLYTTNLSFNWILWIDSGRSNRSTILLYERIVEIAAVTTIFIVQVND